MSATTRVSLEEFLSRPDIDECRLELIDGEVREKVAPRWGHGRIVFAIGKALDSFGFVGVEPRAIIPASAVPPGGSPLPDLGFYIADPPPDDDWMRRPPDIIVEALSLGQSRRAMRAKVELYRAFGVGSVWVVDLERETIEVHEAGARKLYSGDEAIHSQLVPGLRLVVRDLFTRGR